VFYRIFEKQVQCWSRARTKKGLVDKKITEGVSGIIDFELNEGAPLHWIYAKDTDSESLFPFGHVFQIGHQVLQVFVAYHIGFKPIHPAIGPMPHILWVPNQLF